MAKLSKDELKALHVKNSLTLKREANKSETPAEARQNEIEAHKKAFYRRGGKIQLVDSSLNQGHHLVDFSSDYRPAITDFTHGVLRVER